MIVEVPIRLESIANISEHWAQTAKRKREHRAAVWYALKAAKAPHSLPCKVTLTRIAPRQLDSHDNLRMSAKACVDSVTDWLDLKTDADPRVSWEYAQLRRGVKDYSLLVEIVPAVQA